MTIHARETTATFAPTTRRRHVLRRREDAVRPRRAGAHTITVDQSYSDYRKGAKATLDSLSYLPLQNLKVIDLDTAHALTPTKTGAATTVALEVPITNDKQSAHLRVTGTLTDPGYTIERGDLVFSRTMKGLRNTVLLPAGWEVSAVSQSATIGQYRGPRVRRADQPQRGESVHGADPRKPRRAVRRGCLRLAALAQAKEAPPLLM